MNDSLCCGCLVTGRRVWPLPDSGVSHVYSEIVANLAPDLYKWGAVCWECRQRLRNYEVFKYGIRHSHDYLLAHMSTDPSLSDLRSVAHSPRLSAQSAHAHSLPAPAPPPTAPPAPDADCKLEFEFIKSEERESDGFDADCIADEPTLPQHDHLEDEEEKPQKEKKGKKKRKQKMRRSRDDIPLADLDNSSDGLSDMESGAECYDEVPIEKEVGSSDRMEEMRHSMPLATPEKKGKTSLTEKPKRLKEEKKVKEDKKLKEDKRPKEDKRLKDEKRTKEVKRVKELTFDPSEVKMVELTHEEMLQERKKESLQDHFTKSPFRCDDCVLGFKYERTLLSHIESKHSQAAGEHECPTCKVRFPSRPALDEHEVLHLRCYKCQFCGKTAPCVPSILKHVKNHKEYRCETCGLVSDSLYRHRAHVARQHAERPQCVECNKVFSGRKTYRYHAEVIHNGKNRFPCPHCGKVYQWKSNLWRHIKNHKARDSGELYCAPCNKKFSSIATYQQHLKVSRKHVTEEEFNYMCSECGKKFANKTRLKDHVDWDHLNKINYRCEKCDKPFKSATSLYVHQQNVHRNKDEKDNLCHVCGKSYQNIAKLKYHIVAMHTTDTPYTCEQCPSAFSWYSSLYRHIKEVHEKVKLKKKRPRRKDAAGAEQIILPLHQALPM